jgi:ribosomal protein S18 acetylase RimI-like enzyme
VHLADRLPGFIALQQHQPVGLVTYHLESGQCEITSLDSLSPGVGIGSALIAAVKQVAETTSCQRLWLITTNDNIPAIRFYQKRGFHLVAVHPDALEISRQRKPGIPKTGFEGIPLRDELEFEMALSV